MRAELQNAHSYWLVDKIVVAFERYLAKSIHSVRRYPADVLARRLSQAVAMHLTNPFLKNQLNSRHVKQVDMSDGLSSNFQCGGLKVNTGTGDIAPSGRLLLHSVGKFIVLWFVVSLFFLRRLLGRTSSFGKATLVYGVPDADLRAGGSALRFEEFCQKGNIEVLRKASRYVVQSAKPVVTQNEQKFIYTRFPLLELFGSNNFSFKDSLLFIVNHFSCLFVYFAFIFRTPISCLLWRDFAENAVALHLNRRQLIEANIITNSNWLQQFLWMTNLPNMGFLTYMALYSLNTNRLVFKNEPDGLAEHPGLRHLNVDCVFIWYTTYEQVLRRLGIFSEVQVVGPILWYLPDPLSGQAKSELRKICVFDVSPFSEEALLDCGLAGSYYSNKTMISFLLNLLIAVQRVEMLLGLKVEILLKHKRKPLPSHDDSYFSCVNEICESNEHFRLVKEDVNLFTLISESEIAIVIPYSSPGYVANYLGVPSLFYDPTNEIFATNENNSSIKFVADLDSLTEEISIIMARNDSMNCTSVVVH